ncbi:MAG TPA: CoA transferase, partial [Burkholderiaceae bacterium]|nr:CoA transferase [Burkholderiaceae bacterium]
KIYSAADILNDPHYQARDMIREIETRDGTRLKVPGIVPKLSETPGQIREPAPDLGQHTDTVLRDLGLSDADVAELRRQQIIG